MSKLIPIAIELGLSAPEYHLELNVLADRWGPAASGPWITRHGKCVNKHRSATIAIEYTRTRRDKGLPCTAPMPWLAYLESLEETNADSLPCGQLT